MNKSIRKMLDQVSVLFQSILSGSKVSRVHENGLQCSRQGEVYDNLKTVHQYGFYSKPPLGSDALMLSNGDRRTQVIIGTRNEEYPELEVGESCLYSENKSFIKAPQIALEGEKVSIGEGKNELIGLLLSLVKSISKEPMKEGNYMVDPLMIEKTIKGLEALKI